MQRVVVATMAASLSMASPDSLAGQPSRTLPVEPGWLPLFNRDLVVWLENENRLDVLCPTDVARVRPDCHAEMLEPRPLLVPLRPAPDLLLAPKYMKGC